MPAEETFLNIRGADQVLAAIRRVFASLYNDRAISYRAHKGFTDGALASRPRPAVVRSDLGASGVMFTLDTESGFRDVCSSLSWGLGECGAGRRHPDEFYVQAMLAAGNRRSAPAARLQIAEDGVFRRGFRRAFGAHRDLPGADAIASRCRTADVLELSRVAAG